MGDIFGKQVSSEQIEGLIDSVDEQQFEGVQALSKKWEAFDTYGDGHGPMHSFVVWFKKYKADLIKKKMLKLVRVKAGLGEKPSLLTTNASDSMNAVLKRKVDYKKNELPEFLEQLRKVIDEQQHELERAIINKGKYRLSCEHKKLEISEDHWFMNMSKAQREEHIKILSLQMGCKVTAPRLSAAFKGFEQDRHSSKPSCSRQLFTESKSDVRMLSFDISSFASSMLIPRSVLEAIWHKAYELISDNKSTVWCPEETQRIVWSEVPQGHGHTSSQQRKGGSIHVMDAQIGSH